LSPHLDSNRKEQPHPVKEFSDVTTGQFLTSHAAAHDGIIGALAAARLAVLPVRTDQESLSHAAQRVVSEIRKKDGYCS
jgi:hypothetical protein